METNFKNVKFLPWVGKNYEKGINGKKILVLGESHYGSEERTDITNDVVSRFLKYHKGEGEFEFWMNTNTKFAKTFNNGEMSKEEIVEFWESIVFYNYVQTLMSEPRQSPTSEQFENSKEAFYEVIEQYQPDLIVVWGLRLWGAMPDQGRWGEPSQVNGGEGLYYYQIGDREYPAMMVYHPSTGFNYASAYEDIKLALEEIK